MLITSGSGWDQQGLPRKSGSSQGQLQDAPKESPGVLLAYALAQEGGSGEGGDQDGLPEGQADVGFLKGEGKPRLQGITALPSIQSHLVLGWEHRLLPAA